MSDQGKDIFGIRDEGDGWCTISVNSEEYWSDYSGAVATLKNMIKKLEKWEERESS